MKQVTGKNFPVLVAIAHKRRHKLQLPSYKTSHKPLFTKIRSYRLVFCSCIACFFVQNSKEGIGVGKTHRAILISSTLQLLAPMAGYEIYWAHIPDKFFRKIINQLIKESNDLLIRFSDEESVPQQKTPCELARERKLTRRQKRPGTFVPKCKSNGEFRLKQCHKKTKYCWCVDREGRRIPGTKSKEKKLNCRKGQ